MSELLAKQMLFSTMVSRLLVKAVEMGYQTTLGEAYRTPEQAALDAQKGIGIVRSLHCDKLAIDINLFKNGGLITASSGHLPLGEWWESIGGTWGGRFRDSKGKPKPDGNHYSLSWQGRK